MQTEITELDSLGTEKEYDARWRGIMNDMRPGKRVKHNNLLGKLILISHHTINIEECQTYYAPRYGVLIKLVMARGRCHSHPLRGRDISDDLDGNDFAPSNTPITPHIRKNFRYADRINGWVHICIYKQLCESFVHDSLYSQIPTKEMIASQLPYVIKKSWFLNSMEPKVRADAIRDMAHERCFPSKLNSAGTANIVYN